MCLCVCVVLCHFLICAHRSVTLDLAWTKLIFFPSSILTLSLQCTHNWIYNNLILWLICDLQDTIQFFSALTMCTYFIQHTHTHTHFIHLIVNYNCCRDYCEMKVISFFWILFILFPFFSSFCWKTTDALCVTWLLSDASHRRWLLFVGFFTNHFTTRAVYVEYDFHCFFFCVESVGQSIKRRQINHNNNK